MPAQSAATSEQIMLSAWRRDYRLSLALLVAGIVILVAISAFSFWANYLKSGVVFSAQPGWYLGMRYERGSDNTGIKGA